MMARFPGEVRCNFCNKTQDQVRKLIAGPGGIFICDECVDLCAEIIDEETEDYEGSFLEGINLQKPREIKDFLDQYVVGQEQAKKAISVAVYNHYKRIAHNMTADEKQVEIQKTIFLLVYCTLENQEKLLFLQGHHITNKKITSMLRCFGILMVKKLLAVVQRQI